MTFSDMQHRRNRVLSNKIYVALVRSKTVCTKCGAVPVDFHSYEHDEHPHRRVNKMIFDTFDWRNIKAEIARCTPLCRRCHAKEDNRGIRSRVKLTDLTVEIVRAIKDEYNGTRGHITELGKKYGITRDTVKFIVRGRTWADVYPSHYNEWLGPHHKYPLREYGNTPQEKERKRQAMKQRRARSRTHPLVPITNCPRADQMPTTIPSRPLPLEPVRHAHCGQILTVQRRRWNAQAEGNPPYQVLVCPVHGAVHPNETDPAGSVCLVFEE